MVRYNKGMSSGAVLRTLKDGHGYVGDKEFRGPMQMFHCPGCRYGHWFTTVDDHWTWNGDMFLPTVRPSILNMAGTRCHLYMTNGVLEFLTDSQHALAGQKVPMVAWDEW